MSACSARPGRARGRTVVCSHFILLLLLATPAAAAYITAEQAARTAEAFAGSIVGPSRVGDIRLFVDTRNNPAVYLCECCSAEDQAVTLMVGAETGMPPVLLYYRGPMADLVPEPAMQAAAAATLGCDARPVALVYFSPFDLWQEYEAGGKKVMVSLHNLSTADPEVVRSAAPFEYDFARRAGNESRWDDILAGVQPLSDGYHWIDDVPDWDWHYGCAPTAAANVLTFWDRRGYDRLVDSVLMDVPDRHECDTDSVPNVSLQLVAAMNTDTLNAGSTASDSIVEGIAAVCSDPKWENGYDFTCCLSWNDHDLLVYEVNLGRPGVLGLMGHPQYGNHCVTFCGWGPPDERWIMVHDVWSSTNRDVVINYDYGGPIAVVTVIPCKLPDPDLAVSAIIQPADTQKPGTVAPRVLVSNLGGMTGGATACFTIDAVPAPGDTPTDAPEYLESAPVTVEPGKSVLVTFPAWNGTEGSYVACCSLSVPGSRAVLRREFVLRPTVESPRFEQGQPAAKDRRSLSVYPNPVRGIARTTGWSGPAEAVVTDIAGRRVLDLTVDNPSTLALPSLSSGVYLLELSQAGHTATARFLVAR